MKKSFLIIVLTLCGQLVIMAQELEISIVAQKYIDRAEMAMELVNEPKDFQKVIDELKSALEEVPNLPSIIYNLGICYDGMGELDVNNYKKAIEYYRKFLTLNPNEEDKKDVDNRINEAEKSIKNETPKMYMMRAKIAMDKIEEPSDYQKVIDELKQAFFEAPNDPSIAQSVIFNLGVCYHGMGVLDFNNYETAIKFYRLYLKFNPNEEDRINATNRMYEAYNSIGLYIKGVIWARCNVGTPGKFIAKPENYGGLYTRAEAKYVCPDGWRLPTADELFLLKLCSSEESFWLYETYGVEFPFEYSGQPSPTHTLFFPFAGMSQVGQNSRSYHTIMGNYWFSKKSIKNNRSAAILNETIKGYKSSYYRFLRDVELEVGYAWLMDMRRGRVMMTYHNFKGGLGGSDQWKYVKDMKKMSRKTKAMYSVRCVCEIVEP